MKKGAAFHTEHLLSALLTQYHEIMTSQDGKTAARSRILLSGSRVQENKLVAESKQVTGGGGVFVSPAPSPPGPRGNCWTL